LPLLFWTVASSWEEVRRINILQSDLLIIDTCK
jgi:hypothetical protein